MVELLCVKHGLHVVVVHVAQRYEIFLILVLHHAWQQVGYLACVAEEHLALAILHVFLNIQCYCLRDTEILQVFGDVVSKFFGKLEEIVDSVP